MSWFAIESLKRIEIGITSYCNARCPLCPRQKFFSYDEDPKVHHMHLEKQKLFSLLPSFSKSTDLSVEFIGGFGDPILHPDLLEVCEEYLKSSNIRIVLETNGGVRNLEFWKSLGELSKRTGRLIVRFSIDGLSDTNHIYRAQTQFDKIITKATHYIENGGEAQWKFICFEHNQHQHEEAKTMAEELGFKKFILHHTSRWMAAEHPIKGTSHILRPSDEAKKNIEKMKYMSEDSSNFRCKSLDQKSLFINFRFELWPCCYFSIEKEKYERWNTYWEKITDMYGNGFNDLSKVSLSEMLEHPYFQKIIPESWSSKENYTSVCGKFCGGKVYWDSDKKSKPLG